MVLMQSGLRNLDCKGAFLKILQDAREGNKMGKVILLANRATKRQGRDP